MVPGAGVTRADGVNLGELRQVEFPLLRPNVLLELSGLASPGDHRTHAWLCQQPRDRQLADAVAARAGKCLEPFQLRPVSLRGDLLIGHRSGGEQGVRGVGLVAAVLAGQKAAGQRAPRNDAESVGVAGRNVIPLDFPHSSS